MMIAKKENKGFVLYNEQNARIGKIVPRAKKTFDIILEKEHKIYQIVRKGRYFEVKENYRHKYTLRENLFWGSFHISELDKTIKGSWGFKWATQMVDSRNKTLLRIRNKNKWFANNSYQLEVLDKSTRRLEILLTLFIHLYTSRIVGIMGN